MDYHSVSSRIQGRSASHLRNIIHLRCVIFQKLMDLNTTVVPSTWHSSHWKQLIKTGVSTQFGVLTLSQPCTPTHPHILGILGGLFFSFLFFSLWTPLRIPECDLNEKEELYIIYSSSSCPFKARSIAESKLSFIHRSPGDKLVTGPRNKVTIFSEALQNLNVLYFTLGSWYHFKTE